MTNRVQSLRSSVTGARPSGQIPGTLFTNFADRQIGVVNASNAAVDLVAVRYFSPNAVYAAGDYVINAGQMYRAPGAIPAGAFNAGQWTAVGGVVFDQSLNTFDAVRFAGLDVIKNQTAGTNAAVRNNNSAGNAGLVLDNGTYVGSMVLTGTAYAIANNFSPPNAMYFYANGDGGLNFDAAHPAGAIKFFNGVGAGTERMRIDAAGQTTIQAVGDNIALLIAGSTNGMRMGAGAAGAYIDGVDKTGNASYQPLQLGGSYLTLKTNNAERMRIDPAGKVSIQNPADAGDALAIKGSANAIRIGTDATAGYVEGVNSAGNVYKPLHLGGEYLQFYTGLSAGNAERMRIDPAGNVGIGTTNPTSILDIVQNRNTGSSVALRNNDPGNAANASYVVTNGTSSCYFGQTGTGYANPALGPNCSYLDATGIGGLGFFTDVAAPIRFATNSVERMRIDSGGKVGIGNTNPVQLLDLERDDDNSIGISIRNHHGGANANTLLQFDNGSTSGGFAYTGAGQLPANSLFVQSGGDMRFQTGGFTERARITADGFFKASNTGSYASTNAHEMHNFAEEQNVLQIISSANPGAYGIAIQFNAAAPNDGGRHFISCTDNVTARARIMSNGGIHNFSGNNVNLSDATLKEDINPYSQQELDSLEQSFKAVQWCRYKYKDQTHSDWNHGYLAQDVATAFANVAPELVEEINIGKEGGPSLKAAVYATDLTNISHALLARALARIADLEARLASAEVKLAV